MFKVLALIGMMSSSAMATTYVCERNIMKFWITTKYPAFDYASDFIDGMPDENCLIWRGTLTSDPSVKVPADYVGFSGIIDQAAFNPHAACSVPGGAATSLTISISKSIAVDYQASGTVVIGNMAFACTQIK